MAGKRTDAAEAAKPEDEGFGADEWGKLGPAAPVTAETRRPLGRIQLRLETGGCPAGFHCRWINDDGEGRIQRAREAGFAMMQDRDGKPVSKVVGVKRTGGPLVAYRMKIPLEWWLADRAKIAQGREAIMADMMRGITERGGPGLDGRYLPERAGQPISSVTVSDGRLK